MMVNQNTNQDRIGKTALTKNDLKLCRDLRLKLNRIKAEIRQIDEDLRSPNTSRPWKARNNTYSAITITDTLLDKKDKLYSIYREKARCLYALTLQIEKYLLFLSPTDGALLRLYYIMGKTWPQVSEFMEYSEPQIYRLHRNLLRKMAQK